MMLAKHRTTVTAERHLQHIPAVISIVCTAVKRNITYRFFHTALHITHAIDEVGVGNIVKANSIVIEIMYGNTEAIVVHALLKRVTEHETQSVKTTYFTVEVDKRLHIVFLFIGY